MKIAVGCDPNAQEAKEEIIKYIEAKGYGEVTDFGSEDPIYANVAIRVGEAVASKEYDRGILICGTGIGVSIAANKVKGAYAALLSDVYSAQRARLSNDANIACMGAFTTGCKVIPQTDIGRLVGSYDGLPIVGKGGLTGNDRTACDIVDRLFREAARNQMTG